MGLYMITVRALDISDGRDEFVENASRFQHFSRYVPNGKSFGSLLKGLPSLVSLEIHHQPQENCWNEKVPGMMPYNEELAKSIKKTKLETIGMPGI